VRRRLPAPSETVQGNVDEGYGMVADAFRRNFAERKEVGAACAVYRDGRKVVDLWGGVRDHVRALPWEHDTLVTVFSTTKGMASMALAVAHSRRLFDLDEHVATYWPEFGQLGKHSITVRQLLSHQAGLPVIDVPLDVHVLADPDALGSILAAQAPKWEPGTQHGYHGQSLGLYESQLIRRVDPAGRTIGRFFADEVASRLGLEFYIGLPEDVDLDRLAQLLGASPTGAVLHVHQMPRRLVFGLLNPRSMTGKVFRNPRALAKTSDLNRRELLRLELPSVNGTGQVRSIAKAYGSFATGGHELGLSQETISALEARPRLPSRGPHDRVLRVDTAYSFGFMKPCPILPFGSSARAYGHTGSGGSFAFADPDAGLGYAYAMTRMGYAVPTDPREVALRGALYETIG
jgi:CubicO group peptidase (beta-lactamase class C family)